MNDGVTPRKNGRVIGVKPNSTYTTGEFGNHIYKTDELGRIRSVEVKELQLSEAERLKHNSKTIGKKQGDHAGHLIADIFGGSPELDNLVSQTSELNLSSYKKMETKWAKTLENGGSVTDVKITPKYVGDELRPAGFDVECYINGELAEYPFDNVKK